MTNIAPSIFVPLTVDITQPILPARDRVEKLERKLAALEQRRQGVTENILFMARQEMSRIRAEGAELEALHGPDPRPAAGMSDEEVDWMMKNIATAAPEGRSMSIRELPPYPVFVPQPGQAPVRETVSAELLFVLEQAVRQLEGYDAFVGGERERLEGLREREVRRLEGIGGERMDES